jgi:hypothetical protein
MGLMSYMRFIKSLAIFIELYQASLRDMKEFMAFLMMIFISFTCAFYYAAKLKDPESEDSPTVFQTF